MNIYNKLIYLKNKYNIVNIFSIKFIIIIFNLLWNNIKYNKRCIYILSLNLNKLNIDYNNLYNDNIIYKCSNLDDLISIKEPLNNIDKNNILSIYNKRINNNYNCAVLYNNNVPVSYLWYGFNNIYIEMIDYMMIIDKDTVAIFDVFTKNSCRNKGYYKELILNFEKYIKKLGYSKIILWVLQQNKIGINAHMKCGFQTVIKEINYISFLGFQKYKIKVVNYKTEKLLNHE